MLKLSRDPGAQQEDASSKPWPKLGRGLKAGCSMSRGVLQTQLLDLLLLQTTNPNGDKSSIVTRPHFHKGFQFL